MIKALSLLAWASCLLLPSVNAGIAVRDGSEGHVVRFEVFEGLSTTSLPLDFSAGNGSTQKAGNGSLEVIVETRPLGSLTEWTVRLKNQGAEDLRLQPQLTWTVPKLVGFEGYWDGSQKTVSLSEISSPQSYDNLRDMAPWAGLIGARKTVFLGSDPGQILSFVRSSYQPAEGDSPARLSYAIRVIVPAGETRELRFFSADLLAPFGGEREIVQRVHDAYAQWFAPDPSAPASVWGVGAHYWMSGKRLEDIPGQAPMEFLRRMHVTWEWSYAPFKRAGDHWGESQWWDYKPLVPFAEKKGMRMRGLVDFSTLSREDFLKKREEYFNRFRGGFGFMFYTPFAAWAEVALAQSEFPDAIITDPNHKTDLKYYVTGYDRELLILPWFTSFEPVLKRQFKQIAEAYDIQGFAFDVALGGARYRGKAAQRPDAPRAYDEQGDFIDIGAAGAKVIDYVKTLPMRFEPHGRLGATINGMRTFNSAVRGDYGMLEGTAYFSGREQIPLSRYLFGQKPATWWKGWAYTRFAVPNWQRYDQEHFLKTMKGLADYTLFSSFEWGNLPTLNYEFGVPKMTSHVPILIDSLKRGWQAVFPVDFSWEGSIQTGRYGKGLSTRLFWGNPYEESRQIAAVVDNSYLGEMTQVFASRLNGPEILDNKLSAHITRFDLPVASRVPVLIDAVAGFPLDFAGTVSASLKATGFDVKAALRIVAEAPKKVRVEFPMISGYRAPVVKVAGESLEVVAHAHSVSCDLEIDIQPLDLTVFYASELFNFSSEKLAQFPFFTETSAPGFTVVTNSMEELEKLSNDVKLREFVSFYQTVVKGKENAVPLVVTTEGVTNQPVLKIKFDSAASQPGIFMPQDNQIDFVVRNAAELQSYLDRFLAVLDERYPYHPGFVGTWGMDPNLLRHVKMMGENLESR